MFDGPTFSLSEFARDASAHATRIGQERTPELLTVDGKVALVVQDAESYQAMVERLEKAEFLDSLRTAMEAADRGEGRPAKEVFEELNGRYGF